jgi:hypothetical protein
VYKKMKKNRAKPIKPSSDKNSKYILCGWVLHPFKNS